MKQKKRIRHTQRYKEMSPALHAMVQSPHMSVSSKGVTGQSPDVEVSIHHVVTYKDEEKGFKREDRC